MPFPSLVQLGYFWYFCCQEAIQPPWNVLVTFNSSNLGASVILSAICISERFSPRLLWQAINKILHYNNMQYTNKLVRLFPMLASSCVSSQTRFRFNRLKLSNLPSITGVVFLFCLAGLHLSSTLVLSQFVKINSLQC